METPFPSRKSTTFEWLPNARTALEWADAFNGTLNFRDCRFVSLYNWERVRDNSEALEGLRLALAYQASRSNLAPR